MESRELKGEEPVTYFKSTGGEETGGEGTRDMNPLDPFVVSGGENTERFYFVHVNSLSEKYKFNIRPEYFGEESAYAEVFPSRVQDILRKNTDARVFCVFDMDTVVKDGLQAKHQDFLDALKTEIDRGQVVICDSMPSFEFWLLLHFVDYDGLLKDYPEVSEKLAPYIKPYFSNPDVKLKKLLKSRKYLEDSSWVRRLLQEGRIEQAVERAKNCLARVIQEPVLHSYSNVFKAFE